jgi:hypothetical protein
MNHYCTYGRHLWECNHNWTMDSGWPEHCAATYRKLDCDDCERRKVAVASMIVPIICERCGTWKKAEDGRSLYASWVWMKGKRMVCPGCYETEQQMAGLETLVSWDDEIEEMPF